MTKAIEVLKNKWFNNRIRTAYKNVFNNDKEDVAIVLQDLQNRFGPYQSSFHTDTNIMSKKEGNKEVVLHILDMASRLSENILQDVEKYTNERSIY